VKRTRAGCMARLNLYLALSHFEIEVLRPRQHFKRYVRDIKILNGPRTEQSTVRAAQELEPG
jgi:hypothetical protein